MKKIGIIMALLSLLTGCAKKQDIRKISELNPFMEMDVAEIECFLGGGSVVTINDREHISTIIEKLMEVRIDLASPKKNLQIEDGDIVFIFKGEDGSSLTYSFLTSEYCYKDGQYYLVMNRALVREICSLSSDFAEMEREN